MTELKVSLGVRSVNEPGAKARHDAAAATYAQMVARAAQLANGVYDRLDPPLIEYLANHYLHQQLALDEASRWRQPPPDGPFDTRRDREADYDECRLLLDDCDMGGLVEYWGDWAVAYTEALGYVFDTSGPEFAGLCRALGGAACKLWLAIDKRNDKFAAPTPEAPIEPPKATLANEAASSARLVPTDQEGRSFEDIAWALIDNPRLGMKEGVKEHVRTGLRFVREALGRPGPGQLTRAAVSQLLDLMAQRPARLPYAEQALDLRELADRYRDQPEVRRMSARTMEVRLSALSTVWKKGVKEGAIDADLANPFVNREVVETQRREKTAKGFSPAELEAYFRMPPFQSGQRPVRGKGEAIFWLPLVALFTGARPEEVAQLLVEDIFQREDDGSWLIRFTDEGVHPVKGPQTLKTARYDVGCREFPIPQALLDLGLLDYHAYLQDRKELALFPLLRVKGARGGLYESFGGWFGQYVYDQGVLPRDAGRQPVREFRHTWTTAARASGIAKDAREYIQGRMSSGRKSSDDDYGEFEALGNQIDKLQLKVDIVALVPRWRPPA